MGIKEGICGGCGKKDSVGLNFFANERSDDRLANSVIIYNFLMENVNIDLIQ